MPKGDDVTQLKYNKLFLSSQQTTRAACKQNKLALFGLHADAQAYTYIPAVFEDECRRLSSASFLQFVQYSRRASDSLYCSSYQTCPCILRCCVHTLRNFKHFSYGTWHIQTKIQRVATCVRIVVISATHLIVPAATLTLITNCYTDLTHLSGACQQPVSHFAAQIVVEATADRTETQLFACCSFWLSAMLVASQIGTLWLPQSQIDPQALLRVGLVESKLSSYRQNSEQLPPEISSFST